MKAKTKGLGLLAVMAVGLWMWNTSSPGDVPPVPAAAPAVEADATESVRPGVGVASLALKRSGSRPAITSAPHAVASARAEGVTVARPMRRHGEAEPVPADEPERAQPDWGDLRAQSEAAAFEVVEAFADDHVWEEGQAEDVLQIMMAASDEVAALWSQARSGEEGSGYRTHRQMREIQDRAADEVAELVGEDVGDALQEELSSARREIYRGSH